MAKTTWTKILGLTEADLEKQGETVLMEKVVSRAKSSSKDKKDRKIKKGKTETKEEDFFLPEEGQLTIDLYERENFLIVESAIAGVRPQDLEINIEPDLLRIKGKRIPSQKEKNYFYQECFWGGFSRTIILPLPIKVEEAKAELVNGILTIRMPKQEEKKEEVKIEKK